MYETYIFISVSIRFFATESTLLLEWSVLTAGIRISLVFFVVEKVEKIYKIFLL